MDDLTEFLLARIAEDERDARAAQVGNPWRYNDRTMSVEVGSDSEHWRPSAAGSAANCDDEDHWECSDARRNAMIEGDHIVRWQPTRVLAECDAKRRIIEWVSTYERPLADGHWEGHGSSERWVADVEHELLRMLALPYADHPDYRQEWKA